jgi:ADP-ribose pyrophosphatase YjhB (NUDIX family)
VRYSLPGGAQETGETLQQAVIRECQEEIACTIETQDILYVADFFKYKAVPQPHTRHQLEILFQCSVPESYTPRNGTKPDKHQVAVEWLELHDLAKIVLSPRQLISLLHGIGQNGQAVYAGSID